MKSSALYPDKIRIGVSVKIALGFSFILLLLIILSIQTFTNFKKTSTVLDELTNTFNAIVNKTNDIQVNLLEGISDFKRVSSQIDIDSIQSITENSRNNINSVKNEVNEIIQITQGKKIGERIKNDTLNRSLSSINDTWVLMDIVSDYKIKEISTEQEISNIRLKLTTIETQLKTNFDDLFWEAEDDQTQLILQEFYSYFLQGIIFIRDIDVSQDLASLEENSSNYQSWHSILTQRFSTLTAITAASEEFNRAVTSLKTLSKDLNFLVMGSKEQQLGMVDLRANAINYFSNSINSLLDVEQSIQTTLSLVEDLRSSAAGYANQEALSGQQIIHQSIKVMIITTIIAIVVAVLASILILRSIKKPLKEVMSGLGFLADGDLCFEFDRHSHDELGDLSRATETVNNQLSSMVSKIIEKSIKLNSLSHTTNETTAEALSKVQNQTQQMAAVATEMEDMTNTVSEISQSAQASKDNISQVSQLSVDGQQGMDKSKSAMTSLRQRLDCAVTVVSEMNNAVGNIEQILTVIRSIAEQTNLLALNAAIEAARAGEHGRGFAVVADEVRGLATSTQQSTNEIQKIIESLNQTSNNAVNAIEESASMANSSDEQFDLLKHILEDLNGAIDSVCISSETIANAAIEQSHTANSINQHMKGISELSEHTHKSVSTVSENIASVERVSIALKDMTSQFKLRQKPKS